MKAGTALIATVAAVCAAPAGVITRFLCSVAALTAYAVIARNPDGLRTFAGWSLFFTLPLLAIHAVANPAFAVSAELPLGVPYRADGASFAIGQASLIMTLFVPALFWLSVPRDGVIAALARLPLPAPVAATAFDSVALTVEMERRARLIMDAQRARGMRIGLPWQRGAAMLSVIIPLIATLLRDAPVKARLRHELRTSEAAFAAGRDAGIWSLRETSVLAAVLAAVPAATWRILG